MAKTDKFSQKVARNDASGPDKKQPMDMKTRQGGIDRQGKCECGAVHSGECPMC